MKIWNRQPNLTKQNLPKFNRFWQKVSFFVDAVNINQNQCVASSC